MNNKKLSSKVWIVIMMILFFAPFLCILLRFGTRQVLIEKLNMNNVFTRLVFFDDTAMLENNPGEINSSVESAISIDWQKLYPFDASTLDKEVKTKRSILPESITSHIEKYISKVDSIEDSIDTVYTRL